MARRIPLPRALKDAVKARLDSRYATRPELDASLRKQKELIKAYSGLEQRLELTEIALGEAANERASLRAESRELLNELRAELLELKVSLEAFNERFSSLSDRLSATEWEWSNTEKEFESRMADIGDVAIEGERLARECAKAIDYLLAGEVAIRQRLDSLEEG